MDGLKRLYDVTKNLAVLYVEDDEILRKKTSVMLENLFKSTHTASNGEEALDLYEEYHFKNKSYYDLVISDVKMPVMDGVVLSKNIKKINKKQNIIITSAYDESEYLIEFINVGISKFIKKPFTLETIVTSLLDVCEHLHSDSKTDYIKIDQHYKWMVSQKVLLKDEQILKLSSSETIVLNMLLLNQGQIFSPYDFFYMIVSEAYDKELSTDSIKSIIKRLRKKLPENLIETVYAEGYKINYITQC